MKPALRAGKRETSFTRAGKHANVFSTEKYENGFNLPQGRESLKPALRAGKRKTSFKRVGKQANDFSTGKDENGFKKLQGRENAERALIVSNMKLAWSARKHANGLKHILREMLRRRGAEGEASSCVRAGRLSGGQYASWCTSSGYWFISVL